MRVIVSLCLVIALAGCGVKGQSDAHVFDESEVPYGLTGTTPPTTAPAAAVAPFASTTIASIPFELYFINRSGVLVAVTRRAGSVPTASEVVTKLVQGPTEAEVAAGHRSAITSVDIVTRRPRRTGEQRGDRIRVSASPCLCRAL